MNEYFLRIVIALFLGLGIGIERSVAHKTAGMRTYGLVAMGASLFVILGQITQTAMSVPNVTYVTAAVIMGIGFLCGGVIVFQNHALQGLTTAAGIWLTAGIGMAVGFGEYYLSIFTTATMLIVLTVLWHVENKITKRDPENTTS